MKKLFSIALGLLVFFGSVGVPLFRHTCSMEDVTIHTLFTASDHCEEMEAMPAPVEKSCCASETPAPAVSTSGKFHVEKEPCCQNDVERLALQFGFFQHWQLSAAVVPEDALSVLPYLLYAPMFPREEQLLFASNSDPPPLTGRERLCAICILRL